MGSENAIKHGIAKAAETVRGIKGARVKEQKISVSHGNLTN